MKLKKAQVARTTQIEGSKGERDILRVERGKGYINRDRELLKLEGAENRS